jgi:GMP synthase (glutamine-hydrolysing)
LIQAASIDRHNEIRMRVSGRSAVVVCHVAFEDLGLLAPVLDDAGWSPSYRMAPTDELGGAAIENADLLIVLGGPIGAYETDTYPFLSREIGLLERRMAKDLPTLGICLGGQLMAKALGARVFAGPAKEIGWGRVELTAAGRESCLGPLLAEDAKVLHWHGDTFDLPAGATRLAFNAHYENQAFGFGRRALALQFHLETASDALEKWVVGHAVELSAARVSVPDLRAATADMADRANRQARSIFSAWLREIAEE